MGKWDPGPGKYMTCGLLYQGDVVPKDMDPAIAMIERASGSILCVHSGPTASEVGIHSQPPTRYMVEAEQSTASCVHVEQQHSWG